MKYKWTEKRINFLKENVDKISNKELAKMFYITYSSMRTVLFRNRITRKKKEITYTINKNGCYECTSYAISKNHYPYMQRNGKRQSIARFIYEQYNNTIIPKGMVVRHSCYNRKCINPLHLSIGTPADNVKDTIKHGRTTKGSKNPQAKLNEKKVKQIKIKLQKGYTDEQLAIKYNVTKNNINYIRNNKTWKHVK